MEYNEFISQVVNRGNLANEAEALTAIDATLTTLSERLAGDEPANLAAQLPEPIKAFLTSPGKGESFDVETFINRVAGRESVPFEQGNKHARAVMGTVAEAVSGGEATDIMAQLPVEFSLLFVPQGDFLTQPETWT